MPTKQNISLAQAKQKLPNFYKDHTGPLDPKRFKKLLNETMSVKEAREFSPAVDMRLGYIVHMIHLLQGSSVRWLDFDNNGHETRGYFDSTRYESETDYDGEFTHNIDLYDRYFPTQWFYQDFEDELLNEIKGENESASILEQKKQQQAEELKKQQQALWKKLSVQERKLVKKISEEQMLTRVSDL